MSEAFQEAEEPKVENLDEEEIEIELVEPAGVTRTSPYAIASFAVVAFWLAAKAEDEIFVDGPVLGGVGLYRAARALPIVAVSMMAVGIGVSIVSYLTSSPGP